MGPEGATGSRRERISDVEVLHCRSIEMLGSLVALCDYRPTLSTPTVRGRRLALGPTALRSPPMHRRTALGESLDFRRKARVSRRSEVMDRSPSLILIKSKRATPLCIKSHQTRPIFKEYCIYLSCCLGSITYCESVFV